MDTQTDRHADDH